MSGENNHVVGWSVERGERQALLERFASLYPEVVADHVTLKSRLDPGAPLPGEVTAQIVGMADDGEGVQALIVSIDGTTNRPGGGTFHITWSLAPGRRARESNDVIAARGWTPIERPTPVTLIPARWP